MSILLLSFLVVPRINLSFQFEFDLSCLPLGLNLTGVSLSVFASRVSEMTGFLLQTADNLRSQIPAQMYSNASL